MYERGDSFNDYVRDYGLERSEGVLLRYLMDAYKTATQTVPERYRTDDVLEALAYLRVTLAAVDTSLLDEWEELRDPEVLLARARREPVVRRAPYLAENPKALTARVRAELHRLLQALARREWDDAALCTYQSDANGWSAGRLEEATAPLFAEHRGIDVTPHARASHNTLIEPTGSRTWRVVQKLIALDGDDLWMIEGRIDLTSPREADVPLVSLERIGT
jgi:hypothetical protein